MFDIYVGNLSYDAKKVDLLDLFTLHGNVDRADVVMDRMTERSKGFGFVTMSNREEALQAIAALDGTELLGRRLTVSKARERKERPAKISAPEHYNKPLDDGLGNERNYNSW